MVLLYDGELVFLIRKDDTLTLMEGEDHMLDHLASKVAHQRADISRLYLDLEAKPG